MSYNILLNIFKFQEQSSKFKEIEDRAVAAEQKLQQRMSSWEEQKKAKASETKKLEARCADLVNQNSTLHSQLEKVCSLIHCSSHKLLLFYFRAYARKHYAPVEIHRYTVAIRDFKISHYGRLGLLDAYAGGLGP